jgi:hypothetical protein
MNGFVNRWLKAVLLLTMINTGCDCSNVDCDTSTPDFYFHYVSATGDDLLTGPTKKYEAGELRLSTLSATTGDTIYSQFSVTPLADSLALAVTTIYEPNTRWFLEVNEHVTDTIDFVLGSAESHCCGTYYYITKRTLNGDVIGNDETVVITERN